MLLQQNSLYLFTFCPVRVLLLEVRTYRIDPSPEVQKAQKYAPVSPKRGACDDLCLGIMGLPVKP